MSYQQLVPGQTYPEDPINENMAALGQAFAFSHNKPASTDLDVGISGGVFNGADIADDVLTCTDDDETYIVALRADGTLSAAITTTNWTNTTTYGRVARVTFVDGALTAFKDERFSVGGIFDHSALISTSADADTDFSFTSETGSTADSDPGAGLFKWNNATQASSTFIYLDEATADAVNLDTYMATLAADSTLHIVQGDDATKWQEWKLTAAPVDGTGYWKLAVSLLASGGSIADGKACSLRFDNVGASGLADGSVTNAKLADMATKTIKGRTTSGTGVPEDLTAAQAAAIVQGDGLTANLAGFRGIPINSQSGNYTTVAADSGALILHPSGAGAGDTFTIDSNANVAYQVGTAITFVNMDSNALSIAIASDTLNLAGTGTTGTRSLAQYGVATAVKVTTTGWLISGTGLT